MKKTIALICTLILALSLAACGNNTDGDMSGDDMSGGSLSSSIDSISDSMSDSTAQNTAKITRDDAKKKVLEHAKIAENEVKSFDIELDRDGDTLKYEVKFHHNGTSYDYEIDANSGEVISVDKEKQD